MSDRTHHPVAALGVALVLICWPVWWLAGMLADWTGIGDLDLIIRTVAMFAFLTLIEAVSERLTKT